MQEQASEAAPNPYDLDEDDEMYRAPRDNAILEGSAEQAGMKATLDALLAGGWSEEASYIAERLEDTLRIFFLSCALIHTLMGGSAASPVTVVDAFEAMSSQILYDDPDNVIHAAAILAQYAQLLHALVVTWLADMPVIDSDGGGEDGN